MKKTLERHEQNDNEKILLENQIVLEKKFLMTSQNFQQLYKQGE